MSPAQQCPFTAQVPGAGRIAAKVLPRHVLVAVICGTGEIAEHLRACAVTVAEAVNADDAKASLIAGPDINVLMSDTQLAGEGSGFVLAQRVRRHRPATEIILTGAIASKAQAAAAFVARLPDCEPNGHAASLEAKLNAMLAERKRRLRPQPKGAPIKPRRRRA